MKFKTEFKTLIKKLSQDPNLREAIDTMGRMKNKDFAVLPQAIGTALLFAGRFAGKGRMRSVTNFVDAALFLISLSLLIKQNVFDRPEVQEFFRKLWNDIGKTTAHLNKLLRDYVDKRLRVQRKF